MKAKNLLIIFAVIGLGLAITGLLLNFISLSSGGALTLIGEKFSFLMDVDLVVGTDFTKSLFAFAILTVCMAGITLIASLLEMANILKCKIVKIVLANLTLACSIVTLVLTISFCSAYTNSLLTYSLAEGAYLLVIGGFISGIFGFFNFQKPKKRKARKSK